HVGHDVDPADRLVARVVRDDVVHDLRLGRLVHPDERLVGRRPLVEDPDVADLAGERVVERVAGQQVVLINGPGHLVHRVGRVAGDLPDGAGVAGAVEPGRRKATVDVGDADVLLGGLEHVGGFDGVG